MLVSLLLAPERGVLWEALKRWRDQRELGANQVLTTLYGLAAHHKDPLYPAEQGMIDTYHGLAHAARRWRGCGSAGWSGRSATCRPRARTGS